MRKHNPLAELIGRSQTPQVIDIFKSVQRPGTSLQFEMAISLNQHSMKALYGTDLGWMRIFQSGLCG